MQTPEDRRGAAAGNRSRWHGASPGRTVPGFLRLTSRGNRGKRVQLRRRRSDGPQGSSAGRPLAPRAQHPPCSPARSHSRAAG